MFYGTTEYLWVLVKLLAFFAAGLSCFVILRKVAEELSINRNRRRMGDIDSALNDFMNSLKNSTGDPIPKILLNTRLDELAYILDQSENHPDIYKKQLLYKTVLCPGKLRQLKQTATSGASRSKRMLAIKILGKSRSDEAVHVIRNIIDTSNDPDIIYAAIQALGKIESDISVKALVALLGTGKFSNSKIAAILETLQHFVLNNSLERRNDPDATVRFWVANLLGNYENDIAFEALKGMLEDNDPNVRAAACESLGRVGDQKTVDFLHMMLGDDYWFVRLHAIKALGQLLSVESIVRIIPSLRDRNWWVRYNAKGALKKIGLAVTPYMYPMLKDDDRFARNSAVEILEETGAADIVFDKITTHNISDESTYRYFIDFIKAEGFLWLRSRLKNMNSEKRQTVLKRIEKEDKKIYAETLGKEFIAGNIDDNDIFTR